MESHKQFTDKYHLSYILLSDDGNRFRKMFGVPSNLFGLISGRVTYAINKEGIVIHTFNSQLQAERHIAESMNALKKLGDTK